MLLELSNSPPNEMPHLNVCNAFNNGIVSLFSSSNTDIHTSIKSIVNSFSDHLTVLGSYNFFFLIRTIGLKHDLPIRSKRWLHGTRVELSNFKDKCI